MNILRFTLVTDGSSDIVLLPILRWLLIENGVTIAIEAKWADLRRLQKKSLKLKDKILSALEFYPCELLFIHRDAEREPREKRIEEIKKALKEVGAVPSNVCVIPVRMQEAWLLFNENAIRSAAGNRNGRMQLTIPPLSKLETLSNPKDDLHDLLRQASGLQGRRLKNFNVRNQVRRVADFVNDYSSLRELPAFLALENDIKQTIDYLLGKPE